MWQLKGVISGFKSGDKPGYVANLRDTFWEISDTMLSDQNSSYELKFFQKECMQYLQEYMLIDGVHLVRRVAS